MTKRIFLFFLVNILILVTITIVASFLGVNQYMSARGLNYESLLVFCLVWGFGGAFISLLISRWFAKFMLNIVPIDPQNCTAAEHDLYNLVSKLAHKAGLSNTPEVGIYRSSDINAFATGPSKNRALVAVSSQLFQQMNHREIEGVLAHEITHIANGDMVTMTLIQGVINAFVMFFARIIAYSVTQFVKEDFRPFINMIIVIGLEIALSVLGMIVIAWFSRSREFRADEGGARLAGKSSMISALTALEVAHEYKLNTKVPFEKEHASLATLQIAHKRTTFSLFSTHPPLSVRIQTLQDNRSLL